MLVHELYDADQFGPGKSVIGRERNRVQPELGLHFLARDVDARRLIAFAALEMKAIRPDAQHGRHGGIMAVVQ